MRIDEINYNIKPSTFKYTLPQAIRICFGYLKIIYKNKNSDDLYNNHIVFKSNHSLSFQRSELSNIEFIETKEKIFVEITLNFLGIFGSASPLPVHYSELVLESFDSDRVLYDFLNLFNHNLQKFIYPIWEKHRYYVQYKKGLKDRFSKYILSFLGLYGHLENSSSLNLEKLIPYMGILIMKHKSAGTLKSILRHYLSHNEIEIIQCIPANYNIPSFQYSSLGQKNISLGSDFLIGESILSKNIKFRILLENVTSEDLIKFSIKGDKLTQISDLISFSLNEPLEHEICLKIKKENKVKFLLDEKQNRYIGINTWLGISDYDEEIIMAQEGK
ncbi:type VI secretion system baseplate subunit TssG [Arcobacter sp.]|uniref:type VI secretion system baseplate subunit TssG n=1 Tax=Arcobacter sp. TaxID=1872629 RepID=UPI003C70C467